MIIQTELGIYIEKMMRKQERHLKTNGKISPHKTLSQRELGKQLEVSSAWINNIIRGDKMPNDDFLLKLANFLEIDEHELFRVARRIHPEILKKTAKEYLGEYYIEGII